MAGEIQASFQAGKTVYAQIRNQTSGFVWSLSGSTSGAFEAYATANIANYAISMTEQGTASAYYAGNFPTTIAAGGYAVIAKQRIGASVAEGDPTVANNDLNWDGSKLIPLSDLANSGQIGQLAPIRIAKGIAISGFPLYLKSAADHITAFTSGVLSGQVSKDGGAFAVLQSGAFTEVGNGFYKVNLTSGDLNFTVGALLFTAAGISGGTADPLPMSIITQRVSGA